MEPEDDLSDTLYPSGTFWRDNVRPNKTTMRSYHGRDRAKEGDGRCWTIHCTENMGGCGAEISGDSEQEAIDRWNHRAISENVNTVTLTKYVLVFNTCKCGAVCFSSFSPPTYALRLADFVFPPGEYTYPLKDRFNIFSNSHPELLGDTELNVLLYQN